MFVRFLTIYHFCFFLPFFASATTLISPLEYTKLLKQKTELYDEIDMSLSLATAMIDFDKDVYLHKYQDAKKSIQMLKYQITSLRLKISHLEHKIAEKKRILGTPRLLSTHIDKSEYSCLNPYRSSSVKADLKRDLNSMQKDMTALLNDLRLKNKSVANLEARKKQLKEKNRKGNARITILKNLHKMVTSALVDLRSRDETPDSSDPDWVIRQLKPDPLMNLLGSLVYQKDPVFNPGEEFRIFYTSYSVAVRKIIEVMDTRISHLESIQKLVSPVHYQHEFLERVIKIFPEEELYVNKIMDVYRKLALQLHWYKTAASAIASGEVNGDESMLFGGRELALAALEGVEGVADEIPLVKSLVRVLALGGLKYIHNKQLKDNQQFSFATSSFLNSEVFCYAEAGEILRHIDLKELAKRENPADICEPLAEMWKKSVMSCERNQDLSHLTYSTDQKSLRGFLQRLKAHRDRYLSMVGSRFAEKVNKDSIGRRLFRWRNSLNGVLVPEEPFLTDTQRG